jgi:hypothetical protein
MAETKTDAPKNYIDMEIDAMWVEDGFYRHVRLPSVVLATRNGPANANARSLPSWVVLPFIIRVGKIH